ncbi:MAG: alanine--tRNA ligase [Deltaproteobacteria bacterium]|nr:MAG: alanine--tRNA ligase [Deltaproteobacteria bacterium]
MRSTPRTAHEIREAFLRFFEARDHRVIPSAALVPEADPTLMFVNAGMVPFKRVFLGEESRDYKRACSSQKCMRASGKHNDLEEVGRTPRHNTFFEMLGNFSFGDYFKHEAIAFAWELVTDGFGLDPDRLVATVFETDDEAHAIWEREIGLPTGRIFRLGESENFWSMGETGPCGPCSELNVDFGPNPDCANPVCDPACDCGRWLEIWNLVFMQYDRSASGEQRPLPKPSIDTGAGLERVASVLQGVRSNFDTDLFAGILARAQDISGVTLGGDAEKDVSLRVLADHARALTFLIGDGVLPSNEGRGYVLRRILRRAARHGVLLGVERPFVHELAHAVIDEMKGPYPELSERRAYIAERILREEERFLETLSKGLVLLEEEIRELRSRGETTLPGSVVFKLYDTYGFPVDLTADILRGHDLALDEPGFEASMDEQRARARAAWKGSGDAEVAAIYGALATELPTRFLGYEALEACSPIRALLVAGDRTRAASEGDRVEVVVDETPFYAESGGQVGDRGTLETESARVAIDDTQKPASGLIVHRGRVLSGELRVEQDARLAVDADARGATVRNHSGTHLLHAALRAVLGPQAVQKGSLVAPDRLRFDFTHDRPLQDDEIERIEDLANAWIEANAPAEVRTMPYAEAIESGAVAIFEEKYGDEVRVVSFGPFSTELCGGTHARATGEIGLLKVVAQSGIAAGVRRIEALTGLGALEYLRQTQRALTRVSELLRAPVAEVVPRLEKLLDEKKQAEDEVTALRSAHRGAQSAGLIERAREIGGTRVLAARAEDARPKELRSMVDALRDELGSGVVLLATVSEGRVSLALGVTPDLTDRYRAGDLVREVAGVVGGKGGGKADFAQAGGNDPAALPAAFEKLYALVEQG